MINLNKEVVTKKRLLNYVRDIDIYNFYTGKNIKLGDTILSPLKEEKSPSFGYFLSKSGEICFNDFRLGGGDCIKFVQLLFGLDFFEALSKVVVDFNLTSHFEYKAIHKSNKVNNSQKIMSREEILKTKTEKILKVRKRNWRAHDIAFWHSFGITKKTIDLYNVFPIDYIFIGDNHPMLADKYAYVFFEFKDNIETLKIYQPFSIDFKWLNSHNSTIWQGWNQLPEIGKTLIITKSLKDVMSLTTLLDVASVALQSESTKPKESIILDLQNRFETLFLLYDNDYDKEINTGRIQGQKIVKDNPIIQIEIPDKYKSKDFSDLVKNYGNKKAKEVYEESVKLPF